MARILVIEPDQIIASNLVEYLSGEGHEPVPAKDPQGAIDLADSKAPDAIVMDLLLAQRSGTEFLYELRSYPEWQNIPVIVYSNISPEEFNGVDGGFSHLGITSYHYKPTTSLAELARSIKNSLHPVA